VTRKRELFSKGQSHIDLCAENGVQVTGGNGLPDHVRLEQHEPAVIFGGQG